MKGVYPGTVPGRAQAHEKSIVHRDPKGAAGSSARRVGTYLQFSFDLW